MTEDEVWATYCMLWGYAKGMGVDVRYEGQYFTLEKRGAAFSPAAAPERRPMIEVGRPRYDEASMFTPTRTRGVGGKCEPVPADEILRELLDFAHECGHARDHTNRCVVPEAYDRALDRYRSAMASSSSEPFSSEDAGLVRTEEQRAWREGRAILEDLSFSEWTDFERREQEALAVYEANFQWLAARQSLSR